jgi:hypothetical protein
MVEAKSLNSSFKLESIMKAKSILLEISKIKINFRPATSISHGLRQNHIGTVICFEV